MKSGDRVLVKLLDSLKTVVGQLGKDTELYGTYQDALPGGMVYLDNTNGLFISFYRSRGRVYVLDTEVEILLQRV